MNSSFQHIKFNDEKSIGEVYLGTNIISRDNVAIKIQPKGADDDQLEHEFEVYKSLTNIIGVPLVYWFGTEWGYDVLVIDLLGPSLGGLFEICKQKFSLKTVILLADQLVSTFRRI